MTNLKNDFQYFLDNKEKLFKEHPDKFLVIKNGEVIGVYADQITAYTETTKSHKPGTFLIQNTSLEAREPQIFHSRVVALL